MTRSRSKSHVHREHDAHVLLSCEPRLPLLIVCDHASNRIPTELENLGVEEPHLLTHIAWDIGAADVARALGAEFGAPVLLTSHSRLVVDCNRNLDDPTAFPVVSDGIAVPGNRDLGVEEREARANAYYWPYHRAIRDQLQELERLAEAPAVIAIHSFTPFLGNVHRPWHVGILWDKDPRIAVPFLKKAATDPGIVLGDNEPYSGRHWADFTLDHHAEAEGLPHLGVELRQDLIATGETAAHWAKMLARALRGILEDESLYTRRAGTP